ncbi:hypothetical protein Y1Q_0013309 [Alligator mississippiensis]|uniref:Uncharacterized protein n=1 Tax=Alligator mississippiensis TaxID=8496 RepID=A0A151NTB3_ALLMI|nr:hypothetical protein Y1Q_0013309 [Alligator mississippiensis]
MAVRHNTDWDHKEPCSSDLSQQPRNGCFLVAEHLGNLVKVSQPYYSTAWRNQPPRLRARSAGTGCWMPHFGGQTGETIHAYPPHSAVGPPIPFTAHMNCPCLYDSLCLQLQKSRVVTALA